MEGLQAFCASPGEKIGWGTVHSSLIGIIMSEETPVSRGSPFQSTQKSAFHKNLEMEVRMSRVEQSLKDLERS